MLMKKVTRFILVDDDHVCNMLTTAVLQNQLRVNHIIEFTCAAKALDHLVTDSGEQSSTSRAILLLDLNMPAMNGWEFLEQFETLNDSIKGQVEVYVLSSSVDRHDKLRAAADKNVAGYIEKPLTREKMMGILEEEILI